MPSKSECAAGYTEVSVTRRFGSCGQMVEKFSQLGRGLELRNGIELFESAGEGVRQASPGSRRELRVLRIEVQTMDLGQQALRSIEPCC